MSNPFTKHLRDVEMSYLSHFCRAGGMGLKLLGACLALMIHSIFPFVFKQTGTKILKRIAVKEFGEFQE